MPRLTFQFSDVKEINDPAEKSIFNPYGKRAESNIEGVCTIRVDAIGYDRDSVVQFLEHLNPNPDVVAEDDVDVDSEDQWILSRVAYDTDNETTLSETNMLINIHISSKFDVALPDIVLDIDPPIKEGIRHAYSFTLETGDKQYIDIETGVGGGVGAVLHSGTEALINAIDPLFTNDAEHVSTDENDAHSVRVTELKSFLSAERMNSGLAGLGDALQTVSMIKANNSKRVDFPAFNQSYLLIITGKESNIENKYRLRGRIRIQ